MLSFIQFLAEQDNDLDDVSHRQQVGHRLGSNPGGVFEDPRTGSKHYMKFYNNPQQARSEVAAGHIYNDIGVSNLNPKLVSHNGREAVSTEWRDDLKNVTPNYHRWDDSDKHQLAKHFVAGVITKNWDAIGLEHDNVMRSPEGKLHTVDLGGVFKFRAMGGPKEFGHDIAEHESLRNPNIPAGQAFSTLTHDHIKTAVDSTNLDRQRVLSHFQNSKVDQPEQHADAVMGRLAALKDKYR